MPFNRRQITRESFVYPVLYSCDLDLDPMTFMCGLDLDMAAGVPKNKVFVSRLSNIEHEECRHRHRHAQTDATQNITTATFALQQKRFFCSIANYVYDTV